MSVCSRKGLKNGVFSCRIVELVRYISSVAKIGNIVKSTNDWQPLYHIQAHRVTSINIQKSRRVNSIRRTFLKYCIEVLIIEPNSAYKG